jgi:hypothetical protein
MEEPIQFGDPHILNAGIPLEFQKACNDVFHNSTSLPAANAYAPFPASQNVAPSRRGLCTSCWKLFARMSIMKK